MSDRILTEEELKHYESILSDMVLPTVAHVVIVGIIASHRELLKTNAGLSFDNVKAKTKIKEYYNGLKDGVGKGGMSEMDVYHATNAIENVLHAFGIKIEGVNS